MRANRDTVARYMEAFGRSDHAAVLACLTDDVEWIIPGAFHGRGKDAFDREIENPSFQGRPRIAVTRMVEENDIVVAEGTVRAQRSDGEFVNLVFCDVFEMRGGLVRKLISYLMEVRAQGAGPGAQKAG